MSDRPMNGKQYRALADELIRLAVSRVCPRDELHEALVLGAALIQFRAEVAEGEERRKLEEYEEHESHDDASMNPDCNFCKFQGMFPKFPSIKKSISGK
jgi:hypothetical protein